MMIADVWRPFVFPWASLGLVETNVAVLSPVFTQGKTLHYDVEMLIESDVQHVETWVQLLSMSKHNIQCLSGGSN